MLVSSSFNTGINLPLFVRSQQEDQWHLMEDISSRLSL